MRRDEREVISECFPEVEIRLFDVMSPTDIMCT